MVRHNRLNATFVGAVLVAAVAGVVLGTAASAARVGPGSGSAVKESIQTSMALQGVGQVDVRWVDRVSMRGMSPASRSLRSSLVAEVTVASISASAFNTTTGGVPTTSLEDDDDTAWSIDRLATLNVITMYAGDPAIDRIVTSIKGGNYVNQSDGKVYQHIVSGTDPTRLNVGDTVMIFGYKALKSNATPSAPWARRAMTLIGQLQGQGYDTIYGAVTAAYIYSGSNATSAVDHVTLPITDLRNIAQNP